MNHHLQTAFEQVASGREALDEIRDFHSSWWMQAFVQAFDQLEARKSASARDAAVLGLVYCQLVGTLMDRLMEDPKNRISLGTICTIANYAGHGLSEARRFFEYTLHDLEAEEGQDQ